jgi:SSS family solute:Na+ symporter
VGNLLNTIQNLMVGTPLGKFNHLVTASDVSGRFTSLIARGAAKDIGSGVSLIVGVLATQTYAQAIWSGKSDSSARKGALLSALMIPPIGIACTLIGLFMRGHYITSAEIAALQKAGQSIPANMTEIASAAQAFPMFVLHHMPSLFGGIVLGTLFITIVGGGAGLSLGVSTILVEDIMKKVSNKLSDAKTALFTTRVTLLCVLILAALVAIVVPGAVINDFGFLSMGLRGAVVFVPITCALFFPGTINRRFVLLSIIAGPIAVLAGNFAGIPFDSLFLGLAVCLILIIIGRMVPGGRSASV